MPCVPKRLEVNGIDAATGLVELAQAVVDFDQLNREFYKPGRLDKKDREGLDRAYLAMLNKASIVCLTKMSNKHLTQKGKYATRLSR